MKDNFDLFHEKLSTIELIFFSDSLILFRNQQELYVKILCFHFIFIDFCHFPIRLIDTAVLVCQTQRAMRDEKSVILSVPQSPTQCHCQRELSEGGMFMTNADMSRRASNYCISRRNVSRCAPPPDNNCGPTPEDIPPVIGSKTVFATVIRLGGDRPGPTPQEVPKTHSSFVILIPDSFSAIWKS